MRSVPTLDRMDLRSLAAFGQLNGFRGSAALCAERLGHSEIGSHLKHLRLRRRGGIAARWG